jgi:hypothetical protein
MVTDEGSDTIGGGGLDKNIGDCGKKNIEAILTSGNNSVAERKLFVSAPAPTFKKIRLPLRLR